MFKAIWHEKQILIVLLWSVLIFIGYNVFTVEAAEKDDKKVCEEYNGEWKKIDKYGTKSCKFDNEKDQQIYSIRPGYSLDGTSSDAEYGREDLGEELTAAIEDDICDNEDADTTKIDMCKSSKEDYDEGKRYENPDGGAPLYEDELTEDEKDDYTEYKPEKEKEEEQQQIEDWRNEVEIKEGPPPPQEDVTEHKIGSPVLIESKDYDSEENVDRSYEYEGENEATETDKEQEFEEQEFQAEEEDDEADEEENESEDEEEEDNSDSESEEGDE